ncbi:uncharacterized protein [Amphiura filiformis]
MPPNSSRPITGYAVEYASGSYVTSRTEFVRVLVTGNTPKTTIEGLATSTTYHVKVAPVFDNGIGTFSDPPHEFSTPSIPDAGQPFYCEGSETVEQVKERVIWMNGRSAMIGLPLPYCDGYYGNHECHGAVCFCIPGKAPPGSCGRGSSNRGRPFGDDPNVTTSAPCSDEYEAAREAINEATKTGKPIIEARLPYCTQDGYYQSKQCLGSKCYCTTREGKHTGKEVPIWEAKTLVC